MYIALLGRQPDVSIAELERVYGSSAVRWASPQAATINSAHPTQPNIQQLGGTQKIGHIVPELSPTPPDWAAASKAIVAHYTQHWRGLSGKLTLGISAYGFDVSAREVQKTGLLLKTALKRHGVSVRLVPNQEPALSTATAHHNKLGLSPQKVELLIFATNGTGTKAIVAESIGAQNITALAARDQGRPRRDAFVGMLPPKLAQIMINLAVGNDLARLGAARLLDPFCGTGVILQEAALLGYSVYGTDLSEKMIRYSHDNLQWLHTTHHLHIDQQLHEGDATKTHWQQPIGAVVSETYLGQPFSAPPSPAKLKEVHATCAFIIERFLRNISPQIASGTPLVLAVPAWRRPDGGFKHLTLNTPVTELGFEPITLETVPPDALLYYRPDQIVARELWILKKAPTK